MRGMRVAVLFAVVVSAGLAVPGVGAEVAAGPSEEPPMGSHVSAFMQSSTVDVDVAVESEMFDAAFENADEDRRAELVTDRTAALEREVERLNETYERLRSNGGLPAAGHDARAARLASRINALERAIDDTEPRAAETGVEVDLDRLRENASALAGPPVDEVARNVVGVEPPRGPPGEGDAGPPEAGEPTRPGGGPPADGSSADGTPADGSTATESPANGSSANETPANGSSAGPSDVGDAPGDGPPEDQPGDGPPAETPGGDEG